MFKSKIKRFRTENGDLWEISDTVLRKIKPKHKPFKKKKRNYQLQRSFSEMKRMNKDLDILLKHEF